MTLFVIFELTKCSSYSAHNPPAKELARQGLGPVGSAEPFPVGSLGTAPNVNLTQRPTDSGFQAT